VSLASFLQVLGDHKKHAQIAVRSRVGYDGPRSKDDKRKKLYYGSDTHGIDVMEKACSDSFGQGYKLAMDVLVGREVSVELGRETGNGLQVTRPSKPSVAVPSFFWAAKC